MTDRCVTIGDRITFANDRPFVLIGGMNVIEDGATVFESPANSSR